ncbi:bifunctional DNA-formamidopyrimidine glycosylase/DNA-(apurinic or apyrimidinic site) lyase [Nitrosococcus wardiae]|uniref:Formamidopyrimidine-DNA glycosylase n=1 Tax=Nitrosococcus wardiae TaxID=1814290 RepID=A0A4P7BVK5_9GAMM|nr:bifunctional DNA-formamidopyrimidine glycosylase/DNA-(apurinic or apyrimidinic site) lyase [Nitrosococcus wardiae]QBQ53317.1 bifunctional DNA-formamidopyrimidine glycosylase/DNA-(apurinic or apyrimidinic site) lyase [Nitrosococcus wardiae]
MPELPEVETVRCGIEPHLVGHYVRTVIIREPRLRWPVPLSLSQKLTGQSFLTVQRRGKYLLLNCPQGTVLLHLGMSGSLRLVPDNVPPGKHDHLDIVLSNDCCLRFNDPRRFGSVLWIQENPLSHPLLKPLGPEPLDPLFDGSYLFKRSRHRRAPIKVFIMNHRVVVGIGNIYASEALFQAGIHPRRAAGRISLGRYQRLVEAIKTVLYQAIQAGGTTLRDFVTSDGKPGYFSHQLQIYGRTAHPCPTCGNPIRVDRIGQRTSYYCAQCQH